MHLRELIPAAAALSLTVLAACDGGGSGDVATDAGPERDDRPDPPEMPAAASLPLPSGHGLAAGVIRVPPGTSAVHGNVLVSCPPGGSACVVTVAADGMASYDRTGGAPAVTAWSHAQGLSRDNPSVEDLLDHWNDPETLRTAMGLSAVSRADIAERKGRLQSLLDGTGRNAEDAKVMLRNVRVEDIEIIGERDGITYGQWKGGPAGTFHIEFDWRFAEHVDADVRADMELVGKIYSWRLKDDIGTHTVEKGSYVRRGYGHWVLEETLVTDGLVISMLSVQGDAHGCGGGCFELGTAPDGSWTGWNASLDDYEPWWAFIQLDPDPLRGDGPWHRAHRLRLMSHETGHALGLVSGGADFPTPSYDKYVDRKLGTFNGPATIAANGGHPVTYPRVEDIPANMGRHQESFDFDHLGECIAVVERCEGNNPLETGVFLPTKIDFAMLDDIGWELLDADTAAQPEEYGWGAWGAYSAWGVGVGRTIEFDHLARSEDRLLASADAFGIAPATSLADSSALSGTATWSGSLLGADLGQPMLPPVVGDAELQVHLSSLAGTARFDDLTVHVGNRPAPFREPSLEYAIDVYGNLFSDAGGRVRGSFHGPAHEEMAGVLDDRSPNVNLIAGFGGRR